MTDNELNEQEEEQLWRDFTNGTFDRLARALQAEFGDLIGPTDKMLEIARETAVIIAIEINAPGMADPIFNSFEKAIIEFWIPEFSGKRSKRHHAQKNQK